jgi:heavy metal sensor kinase
MPIRLRMTLLVAGLLVLVVAAVGVFVVVRLRSDLVDSIDRNLAPAARQIAVGYEREGIAEFRDTSASLLAGERAASQVLDRRGSVVTDWGGAAGAKPLLSGDALREGLDAPLTPHTLKVEGAGRFRVASRPVTRHGQREVVVTAVSTAPVDRSVRRVTTLLLLALPVALVLTALGAWWLAGRALRPIDQMTATAAAIDAGRLEGRVAETGTRDEVGRLAETLNAMLARVEEGVAEQRRLVADASHELRTPLAAMRSELDVSLRLDDLSPAARAVLESVRDDVDALARTVANLLTLAKVDAGELGLERQRVDLHGLADAVVAGIAPVAEGKDVVIVVEGGPAPASGDARALSQVIRNLVENAIDYSPAGGRVDLRTEMTDGVAQVAVLDRGPGVPPEARERIFERFYRADPSRSRQTGGSGLGLAIARELVEAQGGRLWVDDRDGGGAAFRLELPRGGP